MSTSTVWNEIGTRFIFGNTTDGKRLRIHPELDGHKILDQSTCLKELKLEVFTVSKGWVLLHTVRCEGGTGRSSESALAELKQVGELLALGMDLTECINLSEQCRTSISG